MWTSRRPSRHRGQLQVPQALSTFLSWETPPGTDRRGDTSLPPAEERWFGLASFPWCHMQQTSSVQQFQTRRITETLVSRYKAPGHWGGLCLEDI